MSEVPEESLPQRLRLLVEYMKSLPRQPREVVKSVDGDDYRRVEDALDLLTAMYKLEEWENARGVFGTYSEEEQVVEGRRFIKKGWGRKRPFRHACEFMSFVASITGVLRCIKEKQPYDAGARARAVKLLEALSDHFEKRPSPEVLP